MGTILSRSWWALALSGFTAVLFGILVFSWPRLAVAVLIVLFGAFALIDGISSIITAVEGIEHHQTWTWPLAYGIAGVVAGLVTFAWPQLTALALLFLIAAWAIVAGAIQIFAALELRRVLHGEWIMLAGGALSVLFGVIAILRPGAGALALIGLIGVFAIVLGVARISLAFRLRGLQHNLAAAKMPVMSTPSSKA
jgi:uncharacterized membrane protein HdeD (DUF308 family)